MTRAVKPHGFTIVELMFSTVVFSTILLVALSALLQIGKLYYKGVTTAQTQRTTRAIMDEISQAIQLSGGAISPSDAMPSGPNIATTAPASGYTGAYCIGNTLYTFAIDRQLSTTNDTNSKKLKHGLWADKVSDCSSAPVIDSIDLSADNPSGTDGRELLSEHMRLLRLDITEEGTAGSGIWNISLSVGYGDEDLFTINNTLTPPRKYCKSASAGTQFCAVSELSTTVVRRIL